jgi:muramoyltetrapeptide carboxypeptidase
MPSAPILPRIKPPALQPGDTIGIIAPASNIKRELLESGCGALRRLGYKPFYFDSILEQELYFAGSAERRVKELEEMFVRPEVRAIICARGGYGTNYLLEKIDLHKIKSYPKIFVGASDVTTLLTHLADALGLVTFHGPMATKSFSEPNGIDLHSWRNATEGARDWAFDLGAQSGITALAGGAAQGILYGGCLSLLVASLGTPYEIQTDGCILFMEDVAEKPYQIDRMLMQLKLAGKLDGIRGVIFGEMLDCIQNANQGYTLQDVVKRIVGPLGVPVIYGLRSGHVSRENLTLPIGVQAELQVSDTRASFKILEPATTAMPSSHAARQKS